MRRSRLIRALAAAGAVTILGALGTPGAADGARARIALLGPQSVSITGSPHSDTVATDMILADLDPKPAKLDVTFIPNDAQGVTVSGYSPRLLKAGNVTRIDVTLAGVRGLKATASGELIVMGGAAPVGKLVTIVPALQPSADWPQVLVYASLVAMVTLLLGTAFGAGVTGRWERLGKRAPGPKWSFNSWATTATAVGAVLGTVLASVTLPDVPAEIGKESLVRLNALFGALVVVAPFVFQAIRRPEASEDGMWGWNWSLLLSCSITFGAVIGEFGALALLGADLIAGTWLTVMLAMLGAVAAVAIWYFAVTAWQLATMDWEADAQRRAQAADAAAAQLQNVAAAAALGAVLPPPTPADPAAFQRPWSLP